MASQKSITLTIFDDMGVSEFFIPNRSFQFSAQSENEEPSFNQRQLSLTELFGYPYFTLLLNIDMFRLDQIGNITIAVINTF